MMPGPAPRIRGPAALAATGVAGVALGMCALLVGLALYRPESTGTTGRAGGEQAQADAARAADRQASVLDGGATADNGAPGGSDAAARCDRQAWPYVTAECRERLLGAENSSAAGRRVRVIATDRNAPQMIATPAPALSRTPAASRRAEPPADQAAAAPAAPPAPATQANVAAPDRGATIVADAPGATTGERDASARAANAQTAPTPPPANASPLRSNADSAGKQKPAAAGQDAASDAVAATGDPPKSKRTARERKTGTRAAARGKSDRDGEPGRGDRDRMIVRTIEFADGRRVTITHPVGKEGAKSAMRAVDQAAQHALAERGVRRGGWQEPERFSADADDDLYE